MECSLKTGYGLRQLSNFLNIPFLKQKRRILQRQLLQVEDELSIAEEEFRLTREQNYDEFMEWKRATSSPVRESSQGAEVSSSDPTEPEEKTHSSELPPAQVNTMAPTAIYKPPVVPKKVTEKSTARPAKKVGVFSKLFSRKSRAQREAEGRAAKMAAQAEAMREQQAAERRLESKYSGTGIDDFKVSSSIDDDFFDDVDSDQKMAPRLGAVASADSTSDFYDDDDGEEEEEEEEENAQSITKSEALSTDSESSSSSFSHLVRRRKEWKGSLRRRQKFRGAVASPSSDSSDSEVLDVPEKKTWAEDLRLEKEREKVRSRTSGDDLGFQYSEDELDFEDVATFSISPNPRPSSPRTPIPKLETLSESGALLFASSGHSQRSSSVPCLL